MLWLSQNIFPQPTKIFGKATATPTLGPGGGGRFLIFPKYFPPATKIFSAIVKSILGKIKFENGFSHSQKYFCLWGKVKSQNQKATRPWGPTGGGGRFLILGKYFPPATKIFSAIEKSILGELIFENGFSHSQKYFGGWGKVNSQNQKATSPLVTTSWVPEGVVAF